MSVELLVEIPQEITKIINLSDVAMNLGLRAPTVFVMEGGIALVNGETGTLYRKYTLADMKAKIVDCVYVPGIRSFVLALADNSIITVPEQSKNPNETVLERWPIAIRKLIVAGESEVYVHCEGGNVCHVTIKDLKVKAPSGSPVSIDAKIVDKSDFATGNFHYLAVIYGVKKNAKAQQEQVLAIWKHNTSASGSSQWVDINNNLHSKLEISTSTILHVISEGNQNSFSLISKENKENVCMWTKYDVNGSVLFERNLNSVPTSVDSKGDLIWFYNNETLSCWNPRYGTEIKSFDSPNINKAITCVVSGGADGLHMSLLLGNVVDKNGPTNVYRKEIGNASKFSKRSLFDNIGSLSTKEDVAITNKNALNSLSENNKKELQDVKSKYERKRQLESVVELSHSQNKKLKKINLTTSAQASIDFLEALEHTETISEEEWEISKVLIRNGTLSLHSNPSILRQIVENTRLDVLVELVRYTSDLTEVHVVQIVKYCLSLPTEIQNFQLFGATIVKITEENKHLFSQEITTPKEEVKVEEKSKKGGKKKGKKEEEEEVVAVTSVNKKHSITQLSLIRAIMEATSLRVASFSSTLISEAIQLLDVKASCLLLRILSFSLNEMYSLKAMHDQSGSKHIFFPQFGDHEIKVMVAWMEAILDAHFTELSIQASTQETIRRALFNAIKSIKNVQESYEYVEEAFSLWTQIDRIASKKGEFAKPVLGLYQVETLRL